MTTAEAQLHLRQPRWARAALLAFPVFLVLFHVFFVTPDGDSSWGTTAMFGVFAALVSWQQLRLAVIGTDDGRLVVRNRWSTRRLDREEISGAGITDMSGFASAVSLQLRDGSGLTLDVTEGIRSRRGRMERDAAALRAWLQQRPQPYL